MNPGRLAPPKLMLLMTLCPFRLEREEKVKIDINTIDRDQDAASSCRPQAKGSLFSQSLKIQGYIYT